jgi:tripartite-type tricarboxylate transporter receptor subunit TctC
VIELIAKVSARLAPVVASDYRQAKSKEIRMFTNWFSKRSLVATIFFALSTTSVVADYREQLSGRTMDVMVGFSNSGSGARFWQLVSTHMRRHLPDTVIRVEFKDGTQTAEGISDLYQTEPGSLAIGLIRPPELAFGQIYAPETLNENLRDAHWLMSVENLSYIMVARRGLPTDATTLQSQDAPLILPVNDPLATATVVSVLLSAVTGIPVRTVVGFGRSARTAALLAGDVDMLTLGIDPSIDALIAGDEIAPVYKIVGDDFSTLDPALPDLEMFLRDDAPKTVVNFIRSARGMGRAFFAPPNTDPDDVAALIQLFEAIHADPAFVQDATVNGITIAAKSGDVLSRQIDDLVPTDETALDAILNAYQCGLEMGQDAGYSCDF